MTYDLDDTTEKPTGRSRAGSIPDFVWHGLAHSANEGIAKVVKSAGKAELTEAQVTEWRAWLRRQEVRARFAVTTEVKALSNGRFRFKFAAEHKPAADVPQAEAPQADVAQAAELPQAEAAEAPHSRRGKSA